MNKKNISKSLSYYLRHEIPEDITMDEQGWVSIDEILSYLQEEGKQVSRKLIEEVVDEDQKGRYEIKKNEIRAVYGHSIEKVSIDKDNSDIPEILYHGTLKKNLHSILTSGLSSQNRNEVHLTDKIEEAENISNRKNGVTKILEIKVDELLENTDIKIEKRGKNIYTSNKTIPPVYIEVIEE